MFLRKYMYYFHTICCQLAAKFTLSAGQFDDVGCMMDYWNGILYQRTSIHIITRLQIITNSAASLDILRRPLSDCATRLVRGLCWMPVNFIIDL